MIKQSIVSKIQFLLSKPLIGLNISHEEFVLINNMLKEYDDIKEEIINLKTYIVYRRF